MRVSVCVREGEGERDLSKERVNSARRHACVCERETETETDREIYRETESVYSTRMRALVCMCLRNDPHPHYW